MFGYVWETIKTHKKKFIALSILGSITVGGIVFYKRIYSSLNDLASSVQAQMEQMQEDMESLRQLLENLVGLSFSTELLIYQKRLLVSTLLNHQKPNPLILWQLNPIHGFPNQAFP